MKHIILILITSFLFSCASYEINSNNTVPYESYKSYLKSLKDKNYKSAASILSSKIKNEYTSKDDYNDSFPFFSSIDTVVTNEMIYYQDEFDSYSCLTINGYNSAGEPTTLNFELLKEDDAWKFSYVQIMYHDSKKDFPLSVMCPQKPKQ